MSHLTPTTSLAIAELVLYILLIPLILYILVRHGKHGYDGWGFLLVFSILRITSCGMQIAERNSTSNTAGVINSVGVSALLMACAGVVHEVSLHIQSMNRKISWVILLLLHIFISTGIALAAVGGANIQKDSNDPSKLSTDHGLQKGGYLILLLVVVLLTIYAFFILFKLRDSTNQAMILVSGVLLALPTFVAVRVLYSVIYAFSQNPKLSPVTGTFAVRFWLIFLVQFIAAVVLVVAGLLSRNVARESTVGRHEEMRAARGELEII